MYTSVQELRDEADKLQQTMEECEKCGDVVQLEQLQLQLQQTQSKLQEKNEERHLARYSATTVFLAAYLTDPLFTTYLYQAKFLCDIQIAGM